MKFKGFELFGGATSPFCGSDFIKFMETQHFYLTHSGSPGSTEFVSDNGSYTVVTYPNGDWRIEEMYEVVAQGSDNADGLAAWLLAHPDME